MSEVNGLPPEVPAGEQTSELLDVEAAAGVLGVPADRVDIMIEEGLLRPVDPSPAEPQFRAEEVRALTGLGG